MNKQQLIEKYEELWNEHSPFYEPVPYISMVELFLKDLKQLDEPEPLPFKLKDVVRRIRGFDPTTQTRWLNDILKELGDDYGSMKYRSGYEQGKLEGMVEREKVKVPQVVADFITEQKKLGYTLSYSIDASMSDRVAEWYWDNSELFARAWLDGYEVEEEKRYRISMPKTRNYMNNAQFLCEKDGKIFWCGEWHPFRTKFTRKELEEAGFGWVFDCEGIEIE
jgi:hypothetical protein